MEGKCYYCGKLGHKSPNHHSKNKYQEKISTFIKYKDNTIRKQRNKNGHQQRQIHQIERKNVLDGQVYIVPSYKL